jgi:hypothetical protein
MEAVGSASLIWPAIVNCLEIRTQCIRLLFAPGAHHYSLKVGFFHLTFLTIHKSNEPIDVQLRSPSWQKHLKFSA